ncbi:uncharacterized protein C20orf96 homolog [Thamnophis elegans]|uniref:uncharacterized protein C20orf96 homolog n=1 Tax=Thamnophis elegans TaxID=35005 RepID=UPI001378576C|nr:uncharacterized protein C20orf96 homolog [Thamnophis elegans]
MERSSLLLTSHLAAEILGFVKGFQASVHSQRHGENLCMYDYSQWEREEVPKRPKIRLLLPLPVSSGMKKEEKKSPQKTQSKIQELNQELTRVDTRVHTMQEEVNVLRSYMDKEYPLKAVQIASLLRTIRNLNEEQQDELEDTEDLARRFLDTLTKKARDEQERILHSVADKKLLQYQDGLEQMHRNNTELRRQIDVQKEVIDDLVEEVTELQKSIITLHHSLEDPYNIIFPDVLLRRPKCTPDMEVVLDIPTDDFPL